MKSLKRVEAFLDGHRQYSRLLKGPEEFLRYHHARLAAQRELLSRHGDPQRSFSAIHISGTKGKGSLSAILHSILVETGMPTGLFTSPHVESNCERIVVGREQISPEEFVSVFNEVYRWFHPAPTCLQPFLHAGRLVMRALGRNRHFNQAFAYVTMMAWVHFARKGVEVAVVETGLGGTVDPTNVFDLPPANGGFLVNVVTVLGLEHTQTLGDTIPQIATHKLGILRPHALTVLGPQITSNDVLVRGMANQAAAACGQPSPLMAADAISFELDSSAMREGVTRGIYHCDQQVLERWAEGVVACNRATSGQRDAFLTESRLLAGLRQGLPLTAPMHGRHQLDNLRTMLGVLLAIELGSSRRFAIEDVNRGLARTEWPARFEVVSRDPLVVIDCAHEELSAAALGRTFRELHGDREVIVVSGFMRDKHAAPIMAGFKAHVNVAAAITCTPHVPVRARRAGSAAKQVKVALGFKPLAIEEPVDAVCRALEMRRGDQAVIVFGSFHLVAAARQATRQWLAQRAGSR